ncbi:MAG: MFS transporter [Proteobacteria bacterium]|nr:MFS transporter [Pseudomonadota bacterium]
MTITITEQSKKILSRIISVIMLMELLDTTVLNTALPQIAHSLNVNPVSLKEVLTVYFLSLGIFIPVSGWVADYFGEKKSMLAAIILFTLSSLACGLAVNLPMLVGFRLLQGVGGAFLMPIGRQILIRVFPDSLDRIKAMAKINTITLLGLLMGPIVGGALTTYANWRWIFFINIPTGILGLLLLYYYLPQIREVTKYRFDIIGFILIGLALGSLLFLMDILIDNRIAPSWKLFLLTLAACCLILYILHARKHPQPLISLKLFHQGNFGSASACSFLSRLTTSTHPFLVPLLLQTGYGFTAFHSGLYQVPVIFSTLISFQFIPKLHKKYHPHDLLVFASCMVVFIFCSFTLQAFYLIPALLIIQQLLMGFFLPIQTALMNSQAYQNLHDVYLSQGSAFYSGVIQVSGSFGIASAALVIIGIIGPNDLGHQVPLVVFKIIFIVQSLYALLAAYLFHKSYLPEKNSL